MYYRAAHKSKHKTLAYVEGATHVFMPCAVCQSSPNEFGDTEAEVFDYATSWLAARF
jgi:LSD1 subclass zinc finger protein